MAPHWQDVSPPGLAATTQISIVEASHFDANTAYAAVDRHEENDFRAHFYRTHDAGKTWQEISNGFADGDFARVVREDPQRKGLLYAGTENAAYVSFDEGDHWMSLQLNMPDNFGPRPSHSWRRLSGCHLRPCLLDSRRS